jgi:hypothetical protein
MALHCYCSQIDKYEVVNFKGDKEPWLALKIYTWARNIEEARTKVKSLLKCLNIKDLVLSSTFKHESCSTDTEF